MKKMISKHLCIFIVLVMVMQSVCVPLVFADGCTITLSNGSADTGENVKLSLTIENNPGIAGVELWLAYDKTMLTPVDLEVGDDFAYGMLDTNLKQPGVNAADLDMLSIVWTTASGEAVDGVLCDITFKINESATRYNPVTLVLNDAEDIFDNDFNNVNAQLVSGMIVASNAERPDISGLETAISDAQSYINNEKYTTESINNLKAAINAAEAMLESDIYSKEEVVKATEEINNALSKLVVKMFYVNVEKADNTDLKTGNRMKAFGSDFSETVYPKEGYDIIGVLVNGSPVAFNNNTITITDIRENKNITVQTAVKKYNITVADAENGTVTLSNTVVAYGKSCVVKAVADEGYILTDLLIDGNSVGVHSEYVIENIKANHTVEAVFDVLETPSTVTAAVVGAGGTVSPVKSIVNYDGTAVFVLKADYGYEYDYATANGENVEINNNFIQLDNITEDTEVEVVFKKKIYTVTVDCGEGGSANIVGTSAVPYLDTVQVEIAPSVGYEFKSVYVNGVATKASKNTEGRLVCNVKVTGDTAIAVRFIKDVVSDYKQKVGESGVPSDINSIEIAYEKRDVFNALVKEYATLTQEEKLVCSGSYATVLAVLERANSYIMLYESGIEQLIGALPEAADITTGNYDAVEADVKGVKAIYDSLTVLSKKLVPYELQKKLEAVSAQVDKCKQEAEKLEYLYNIVDSVPKVITEENVGEAYMQLVKAESFYNSLTEAERLDADSVIVATLYEKISSTIGMLWDWYVNPFVTKVGDATAVSADDTVEAAEEKKANIYQLTNDYDMFAGYIRELIPNTTLDKLDKLYASASIVVSHNVDGADIEASGDIDVEAELIVAPAEKELDSIISEDVVIDKALDISLMKNDVEIQPTSKIRIKVPVDNSVAVGEPYVVYIDNNNNTYDVQARIVEEDGQKYIMWDTDHFSCFAILYKTDDKGITFDCGEEFPSAGETITAAADAGLDITGCTLFIAAYTDGGKLESIVSGKDGTATTVVTDETAIVKAFLWKDGLQPVAYSILEK